MKKIIFLATALVLFVGTALFSTVAYADLPTVSVSIPVSVSALGDVPTDGLNCRFLLTPLDGAPMPEDSSEPYEIRVLQEGTTYFPPVSYRAAGVCRYLISQVAGSEADVICDETEYDVTVSVFNSPEGLSATVVIRSDGEKKDTAAFVNTYGRRQSSPNANSADTGLIQTGQLKWPIPVLVIAGALLVLPGLILRRKGGKNE